MILCHFDGDLRKVRQEGGAAQRAAASTDPAKQISEGENNLLRLCDVYNIPLATNLASAEVLVLALDNGTLDWRNLINPSSEYNLKKRRK